ncbi:MAG: hypothetical protein DRP27_06275 [Thermotogae bacterium]|nr:MAG: hypothetical protein DRP27_06275 [Thermotogota bacterium]RLG33415.1 MAG: hypothetical protein DRN97_05120 [Methanosarcinales archaeon]
MKDVRIRQLQQLEKNSPRGDRALVRMRQKAYSDGTIPAKYKASMALCMVAADKCDPCLKPHVEKVHDLG